MVSALPKAGPDGGPEVPGFGDVLVSRVPLLPLGCTPAEEAGAEETETTFLTAFVWVRDAP